MTFRHDGAAGRAEPELSPEQVEAELEVLTRRLGIEIPADLRAGVLRGYRGLRDMTVLLRRAETAGRAERGDGETESTHG